MNYTELTPETLVTKATIPDGYNGHTIDVEYHRKDGQMYLKHQHGCYKLIDLKSLKRIPLNIRLSFPHWLFVAIDKA